jgi:hypothetical protein
VKPLSEKATEKNQKGSCIEDDLSHNDVQPLNNDQSEQGNLQEEINNTSSSKQGHMPLRIQESLLNNGQVIIDKPARPKSMVLPSTNENNQVGKAMYGLKVTSLETLNLPSHGQAPDHTGRMRSFSAVVRRKLSFRERSNSMDEMDNDGQTEAKNKKLKGFRSFRLNRKKKTKALKSEEGSQSTGGLSDSKKYLSTIDKIFHENTGSAIFSDVPFTIPEISE